VVSVIESGACLLVGVTYSTNVKRAVALLIADSTRQERVGTGTPSYGVRHTGAHREQDLKQAKIDLEGQYFVACVL